MNARVAPSALSAAQRDALHVGPGDALPHDPRALVLYARACGDPHRGFAVGRLDAVEIEPSSGTLALAPAPGADRLLAEPSGSFGGLVPPTNVAVARDGAIYLADRSSALVKIFDACACRFVPLPCLGAGGAQGAGPNGFVPLDRFADPIGLAVTGRSLLVADRGHARVVVVDLVGAVPRGALRLPAATGLRRTWTPFGVAVDSAGRVHVSDPDHARIDVFARDGRWQTAWTGLGQVSHLAIDADDVLLAVIENDRTDATGALVATAVAIFAGERQPVPPRAAEVARRFPCPPLAVDREGHLHLGALCGGAGDAVFDAGGYPVVARDRIAPALYAKVGTYLSAPLDSRRTGCVWHRVLLVGTLPARTRIEIRSTASDVLLDDGELADLPDTAWSRPISIDAFQAGLADALVFGPPGRYLWLRLTLRGDGSATPGLARIVVEYPRISLRRYLPGVYGMDPVGADFTDRFTAIFDTTLRSIERRVDTLHELFDPATAPAERPRPKTRDGQPATDVLSWLAAWIGVTLDRQAPEATRRAMLKAATRHADDRGTVTGLRALLLTFLGFERPERPDACPTRRCTPRPANCAPALEPCPPPVPRLILEHFRLRRWLFVGMGRLGEDAALWGRRIVNRSELSGETTPASARTGNARVGPLDCPADGNPGTRLVSTPDPLRDPFHVTAHRFSVFVPARVRRTDWQRRGLERLLAQEAPAHTAWSIEYVEPRFRVGVQAMIGLDSVIARVPAGVRLGENRLGQGSVLPPHPGRPAVVGVTARAGENLRLG